MYALIELYVQVYAQLLILWLHHLIKTAIYVDSFSDQMIMHCECIYRACMNINDEKYMPQMHKRNRKIIKFPLHIDVIPRISCMYIPISSD